MLWTIERKKFQEFLLWWFFIHYCFISSLELIRELQESFQSSSTFQNQFIHNKKYPMFEPEWPLANSATMRIRPKSGYTMCSLIRNFHTFEMTFTHQQRLQTYTLWYTPTVWSNKLLVIVSIFDIPILSPNIN